VPVVVGASGGLSELIQDGENGYLAEPGSVPSLTDAIYRLLTDEVRAKRMGFNARQFVVTRLSIDVICRQVYGLYQEMLSPGVLIRTPSQRAIRNWSGRPAGARAGKEEEDRVEVDELTAN
jgi:hypothetical protein